MKCLEIRIFESTKPLSGALLFYHFFHIWLLGLIFYLSQKFNVPCGLN